MFILLTLKWGVICLTISTKTFWVWTKLAEDISIVHGHHPLKKAGEVLTEINAEGYRVKRLSIPKQWVEKGYVQEAPAEQLTLF